MKAKSIKADSFPEIERELLDSLQDGFKPTLAIIFISIKQDRAALTRILSQQDIDVLGATSCGEFINGYQSEGGIVILLLEIKRDLYKLLFEEIGDRSIEIAAKKLAEDAMDAFPNPSLILTSTGMNAKGEYFDGETLVRTIEKGLGSEKIFFGGMAGDDGTFKGSYIFTQNKETDFGISALVLDANKIKVEGMAITGWKPMGISRKITKSAGNLVYEIDGKPAVEMYLKYLGKSEKSDDKDFNVLQELSFHFPFLVERGDGETLVKSPLSIDHENNALVTDMEMSEGSTFWFSSPPAFEIVEEIISEATQLRNNNHSEANALLIFSCAGRHPVLGPLVSEENDGLAEVWQAPMAGFFTYGEFGRAKNGRQHFHSTACCWVTLYEKSQKNI
jgi:hypothetical protein